MIKVAVGMLFTCCRFTAPLCTFYKNCPFISQSVRYNLIQDPRFIFTHNAPSSFNAISITPFSSFIK